MKDATPCDAAAILIDAIHSTPLNGYARGGHVGYAGGGRTRVHLDRADVEFCKANGICLKRFAKLKLQGGGIS